MKTLALLLLAVLALAGQEPTSTPPPATPAAPADAAQVPAPAAEATPAPSEPAQEPAKPSAPGEAALTPTAQLQFERPAPPSSLPFHGFVDFGWRFRTDIDGSRDVYKSVVNIGDGATLLGADLVYEPTDTKWLNRLRVISTTWGAYPYSSVRLSAEQYQKYNFVFDYRPMEFYSFVPSFANPFLGSGIYTTLYGFNTDISSYNAELTLRPTARIVPYVGWTRGSFDGDGIRDLVSTRNEYPLPVNYNSFSNNYRGGVRFNYQQLQATLEGGYLKYRDSNTVFIPPDTPTPIFGIATAPVFGTRLFLNTAYELLDQRGNAPFTRGLIAWNPAPWVNFSGGFLYSQPESKVNFIRELTGAIVNGTAIAAAESLLTNSYAIQPHPTGDVSVEIRPVRWVRIVESFMTDRLHVAGTASDLDVFTGGPGAGTVVDILPGRLVMNYNRNDLDAIFDVTRHFIVRAGYRRNWGDTVVPPSIPAASLGIDQQYATLEQNVGIFGITFRPGEKLRVTGEYQHAASDHTYFRTSLSDYDRLRSFVRYQLTPTIELGARLNYFNNGRPRPPYPTDIPTMDFDYTNWDNTYTFAWTPQGGRYSLLAEYGHVEISSKTDIINPATLDTLLSVYDESGNTGVLLAQIPIIRTGRVRPRIDFGGSIWSSDGTRPVNYYRPQAKLWIPFGERVEFHLDWEYYGFNEDLFPFEDFHAHTFVTGLRIKL